MIEHDFYRTVVGSVINCDFTSVSQYWTCSTINDRLIGWGEVMLGFLRDAWAFFFFSKPGLLLRMGRIFAGWCVLFSPTGQGCHQSKGRDLMKPWWQLQAFAIFGTICSTIFGSLICDHFDALASRDLGPAMDLWPHVALGGWSWHSRDSEWHVWQYQTQGDKPPHLRYVITISPAVLQSQSL